jgi:uncharacterized membrane protein YfcA
VQPQRIEPHRVLGVVFAPLVVREFAQRLEGVVVPRGEPAGFFAKLVSRLVLFATAVFAWESFFGKPTQGKTGLSPLAAGSAQFLIAIYGGYFGGGISLLVLATLTRWAVAVFAFSGDVHWLSAFMLGVGGIAGGLLGVWLLRGVNDRALRIGIVTLGVRPSRPYPTLIGPA